MIKIKMNNIPKPVWAIGFALEQPLRNAIPKPVWAVGFALEQPLRDATLAVFNFLILKRLQHIIIVGF
ncbi:MAG: hypothetical protein LBH59_00545 [Planctomycetaceae bacterium]|jgi:hypothetical protein|nr:hypothetical protein [Planctomycetaceae bacterium]